MSTARTLDRITLADIRDVLGQNGKKSGDNWLFQCPICQDSSCDNLIVKGNGAYIHCFSCYDNEGGRYVLSEIERKRAQDRKQEQIVINSMPRFLDKKLQEQYIEYMCLANDALLDNQEMLDLLQEKRGIDRQTVIDCGIGYDDTEEHWVIPIFSLTYDPKIMGFEYRRKNFDKYINGSKVRRERGYITDICPVYGCNKAKTLYILEGFLDAMCLHQYLREKGQSDYSVYSCSNGVSSLLNVMNRICFANFNEIKLMLDTDNAGCEVTDKIIDKFSFIRDVRNFLFKGGYKDFGEFFTDTEIEEMGVR